MKTDHRTLVVSTGDVAGLLACASVERRHGLARAVTGDLGMVIPGPLPVGQEDRRRRAIREQAGCYGLAVAEPTLAIPAMHGFLDGELETLALVDAVAFARRTGLDEVLWATTAIHAPGSTSTRQIDNPSDEDLDRVGAAVVRSMLMERLALLDAKQQPIKVEAPYADVTDRQLADLVVDMDLPIWTCWWWGASNDEPAARHEVQRWTSLLRDAGWSGRIGEPNSINAS